MSTIDAKFTVHGNTPNVMTEPDSAFMNQIFSVLHHHNEKSVKRIEFPKYEISALNIGMSSFGTQSFVVCSCVVDRGSS